MQLTYDQKQSIYDKGYVQISGVIPQVMIDRAVRAINHSLGEGIDPTQIQTFRSRSFCPELQREPVITDLLNKTPALALAESTGDRDAIKNALYLLGQTATSSGDTEAARAYFARLHRDFFPEADFLPGMLMAVDVRTLVNLHA